MFGIRGRPGMLAPMGARSSPERHRCAACGNLTRFDVTVTRRTRAFHHYSIGGELSVEDTEVLSETVEEVACRWCGTAKSVEIVEEADAGDQSG